MKLKDIIKVVVFAVIGFIVSMLGSLVTTAFGAYAMYVHTSVSSLLIAVVYIVMCHKIAVRGTAFLYYMLNGLIYLLMGMVPMFGVLIAVAIISEVFFIPASTYQQNNRIAGSFIASQLVYAAHGLILLLIFGVQGLHELFPNMFSVAQAQAAWDFFVNPRNLLIVAAVQVTMSVLGLLLGFAIYRKFFDKSVQKAGVLQ